MRDELPRSKRYVITCAQNATPIHAEFFQSLKNYCKANSAELVVVPIRYQNPTSIWTKEQDDFDTWDAAVEPYLFDRRKHLSKYLVLLADIKVQPTATSPLTGFESLSGPCSGIVGHPKLQVLTVPTPDHKLPKIMMTTGAVTVKNYTQTKTGKKADFHHSQAATVVELDGKYFHLRQINALNDGSFMDLDKEYTATGVRQVGKVTALVMGDSHIDYIDPGVVSATFTDNGSMVNTLKPEHVVWHDTVDLYSKNHHHQNNPFVTVAKYKSGRDSVLGELQRACDFILKHTPKGVKNIFVPSNHPDWLSLWIREGNWKTDPQNAEMYLETALLMVRESKMGDGGAQTVDPFTYWMKKILPAWTEKAWLFLHRDQSFTLHGIELGYHGDRGPNGARATMTNMSRIGVKTITGHSHSPGVEGGAYRVGTSTRLKLEYNRGPSSWQHTHCVIYKNGKRSLIHVIKGRWKLEN